MLSITADVHVQVSVDRTPQTQSLLMGDFPIRKVLGRQTSALMSTVAMHLLYLHFETNYQIDHNMTSLSNKQMDHMQYLHWKYFITSILYTFE